MATKPVSNASLLIRKIIRTKEYATPQDSMLGIPIVNIDAIQYCIRRLAEMGESTREFDTYIASLLLVQLVDLERIQRNTKDVEKISMIQKLHNETKEYLWPTKN